MNQNLKPGRRSGTTLLALGMLLLIVVQLSWWLIFFRRNQAETAELQRQLDRLRIATANEQADRNPGAQVPPGLIRLPDGSHQVTPELLTFRNRENLRAFFMLLSESIFVIAVCSYGTFRVVRTISRERRLNHERQIFIDSVTHELKTPLTSILLNLQTILKREPPREQRRELLEDCVTDVRRLEEQLNNILLSGRLARRPETRLRPARRAATDAPHVRAPVLNAVAEIEDFFRQHNKRLEQARLRLELDLPERLDLRLDVESFRTIISNLVQNTIQYAVGRPCLKIEARATVDNQALLRFIDRGAGIPADERDNVFHAFYRLQEGRRPMKGSGMGLYLVSELVRAAGGQVRVTEPGPETDTADLADGPGTVFEIQLPLSTG